jgi:hypothetical protein
MHVWNKGTVQIGVFDMALRSLEWAFTQNLLRYEPPAKNVVYPSPNILLDTFDLICNQRGIGWSRSNKPFPATSTRPTSIASFIAKLFFKFVLFNISLYLMQHMRPSVNDPSGDTIFNTALGMLPRWALAGFYSLCGGMVVYTNVDMPYHVPTLIGHVVLRQSAWLWPPPSNRPWMSTSIGDFGGSRWHQFFRHVFVVYGARPGGALPDVPERC